MSQKQSVQITISGLSDSCVAMGQDEMIEMGEKEAAEAAADKEAAETAAHVALMKGANLEVRQPTAMHCCC